MKTGFFPVALSLLALAAVPPFAQASSHDHHHAAPAASTEAKTMADGTVRKVDKAAGKITIAHGPLENLSMPAMTMAFRVSDAAMLDKVKVGDKIRFVAERVEGAFTVKSLEVAK